MKVFQCGTHGAPTQCPECVAEEWRKEIASRTVAGRAPCNPADATAPNGPGLLKSEPASASAAPIPEGRPAPDLGTLLVAYGRAYHKRERCDSSASIATIRAAAVELQEAEAAVRTALAAAEAARDEAVKERDRLLKTRRLMIAVATKAKEGMRAAESRAAGLEEALRDIATETYTAQILMEDGASEKEQADTWAKLALRYRHTARTALAAHGGKGTRP